MKSCRAANSSNLMPKNLLSTHIIIKFGFGFYDFYLAVLSSTMRVYGVLCSEYYLVCLPLSLVGKTFSSQFNCTSVSINFFLFDVIVKKRLLPSKLYLHTHRLCSACAFRRFVYFWFVYILTFKWMDVCVPFVTLCLTNYT